MKDDWDPRLENLFAEARQELDGTEFVAGVMAETRKSRYRVVVIGLCAILLLAACIWLFALPIQEFAQLVTQGLTISLIDLGEGWLAWLFTPINNIASLLVLSYKAVRIIRKKIIATSFAG